MGNSDTKLNFRKAVIQLTSKTQVFALKLYLNASFILQLTYFFNYNMISHDDDLKAFVNIIEPYI